MMHYQDIVVTLVDNQNKPLREHEPVKVDEGGRRCKVFIPFESEYKLLVKNNTHKRIKLEVHIDGTCVSGNGLVLDAHTSEYLERFMEVDKKFKYVRKGHADVADPTNAENGIIKVRVVKEKDYVPPIVLPPIIVKEEHHHHHGWDGYPWRPFGPIPMWGQPTTGTPFFGTMFNGSSMVGGVLNDSTPQVNSLFCSTSMPGDAPAVSISSTTYSSTTDGYVAVNACSAPVGEVGATIEGGHSNQIFVSTTWNGDDGMPSFFTFHTLGIDPVMNDAERKEREQLAVLKAKYEK